MLCYVMLCYVMLCYVMLCYVMLCYVMLCYVMRKHIVIKKSKTPATDRLFITDINSTSLSNTIREEYHSAVMTLHYLAKRMRHDILTAVSFCATRVLHPSMEDPSCAKRNRCQDIRSNHLC